MCTNYSRENSVDEQGVVSLSASSRSSCSKLLDPMQRKVPSLRGANTASRPSMILLEASFFFTPGLGFLYGLSSSVICWIFYQ